MNETGEVPSRRALADRSARSGSTLGPTRSTGATAAGPIIGEGGFLVRCVPAIGMPLMRLIASESNPLVERG